MAFFIEWRLDNAAGSDDLLKLKSFAIAPRLCPDATKSVDQTLRIKAEKRWPVRNRTYSLKAIGHIARYRHSEARIAAQGNVQAMAINIAFEQNFQGRCHSDDAAAKEHAAAPGLSRILPPLLAGARARGLCDAFDLLGLAAVFLDEAGMVLHANASARNMMAPELVLASGHLIATDAHSTRAIQREIGAGLAGKATGKPLLIRRDSGDGGLALKVMALPRDEDESCQLLKVIVMLERVTSAGK